MPHREGVRAFLEDVEVFGVVHDWGCGTKPIKKYLKPSDAKFIGIDKLNHVGADVVTDIEGAVYLYEQADFAFCLEVIEHIWNVQQVLYNIWLNLKPGGVLYLSQPFMYRVHKEDDRVRYTHHGLQQLIKAAGFRMEEIQPTEGELETAAGYVVKATK